MAKSVNQNPNARANIGYRDFDMSQHVEFTSTVAQLLPVYYDVLNPGDKIRASQYMKTRTQPLASAAMAKVTEYIEWFFVPMEQIYKPFSSLFYGIQDYDSSLYSLPVGDLQSMHNVFPHIRYDGFLSDNTNLQARLDFKTLMGEQFYTQFVRLADHLGLPSHVFCNMEISADANPFSFTPLLFCAYQKIFMDHYRDGDRIENDPRAYNLDRYFNQDMVDDIGVTLDNFKEVRSIFEMRYRPLKKDFYTNVFPSPIFNSGSASAQQFNGIDPLLKVNQWLTNVSDLEARTNSGSSPNADNGTTTVLNQSNDAPNVAHALERYAFNQANIRTLFAADKLLELTRRAGKHYDAQTLAHFGVEVPKVLSGECYKIGAHKQDIIIGDVVSTSNTDDGALGSPLGEIGGKGYSAAGSREPVEFTAPCHGVLMAIYSAAPELDYYQEGMDKLNALIEKSDFFIPEYDNLGMQPLFGYQTYLEERTAQQEYVSNTEIKGWQYRYMELKQKINRIFTGMQHTQKHWTVGRDSSFVAGVDADKYYHDPASLNSIVEYQYLKGYDETGAVYMNASGIYERDPLIHEIFFDVQKASKMSRYGLMDI